MHTLDSCFEPVLGLGKIAKGGGVSVALPSPSPHRSRVLALILAAMSMSLCLKSSLVIRPHSAQTWGRLGPKTTESKWVNGSTPHSRHEKHMFHVSPWLDPQLGIPNQLVPQLVLAPVTCPPPAVTLSIAYPPLSSLSVPPLPRPPCSLPSRISSA